MTHCACSQVPGKLIPPGMGRLGIEASMTVGRPLPVAVVPVARPAPIVLTPLQANTILSIKKPTPAQAVTIIKQLIPPVANFKKNIPPPTIKNGKASSNLSGFGAQPRAMAFSNLSHGFGAVTAGTAQTTLSDTSAGAALGTAVLPGIGTAIGAAIGAIIGIAQGLFGHKAAVPHVTSADVQQAQAWMQQYTSVAGSVIGRGFSQTAIQDMLTAEAILDPNFWGRGTSTNLVIPAITNFYNEVMTRLGEFFQAMQGAPIGATVTMHDDPGIPGHGKTNLSITYSFPNPGVNAPSYVLGPIFAQFFYVMCTIYQSGSNCSGHLTAPIPQMYTDVLDWFRSSHPQWDTPQPNIVTGTDLSIAAPAAPGVPSTPTVTGAPMIGQTSSMVPTGQVAPGVPAISFAPGATPVPMTPNQTGIYSPVPGGPYSATPPAGGGQYVSTLPAVPALTSGGGGMDMSSLSAPGPLGFSWLTWGLIAAGAVLVLRK